MAKRVRAPGSAAIYARVSTERQATGDRTSLDRQEKNCRRTAAKLGFTVNEQYVIKEAHSASDPEDRANLDKLQEAAGRGQFQYIMMDVIDRTTRGGDYDLADIIGRFLRFDVEPIWAGYPELDMYNRKDRHTAMDLAWKAYEDKETIARRFQEGKDARIDDGKLIRAFMSYGWKWNAEKPRFSAEYVDDADPRNAWVLDEGKGSTHNTARVARHIFTYLAEGWRTNGDASASQFMEQLNAEGVPPPSVVKGRRRRHARYRGRPAEWTVGVISSIVHNESYKGRHPQRRWTEEPRDAAERRAKGLKSTSKTTERDESEWVWTEVPAIVDEATWEDANKQLKRNTKHKHRPPRRYDASEVMLYGGHVRCAACEGAMIAAQRSPTAPWHYKCYGHGHTDDGGRCRGVQILASEVDALVWTHAQEIIRNTAYLRSLLDRTDEVWSPAANIAHYDALIAEADTTAKAIEDEVVLYIGKSTQGIRERLKAEAEANAARRMEWTALRALAVADQERDAQREQRLQQFIAKSAAQAPTLDDLTPDQRRTIVLDLHPDISIGRLDDPRHDRIRIWFALSAEAATHALDPGDPVLGYSWRDASGQSYAVIASESWPPSPPRGPDDPIADFTDVPDLDGATAYVIESGNPPAASPAGEYPPKLPYKSTPA